MRRYNRKKKMKHTTKVKYSLIGGVYKANSTVAKRVSFVFGLNKFFNTGLITYMSIANDIIKRNTVVNF
ncbi:MAG: hypothetical protein ACRCZ9_11080 [Fusobacteriaceae bacterium]